MVYIHPATDAPYAAVVEIWLLCVARRRGLGGGARHSASSPTPPGDAMAQRRAPIKSR
jgi:hypothetical protein